MSLKEVLQNVQYFLGTVVPNAYFAGNWDSDLLNHAFQWAEYCEKVYETSVNQPSAKVIDSQIHAIGCSLENSGSSHICLEYLKLSSKILCEALLQNNFLENSVYEMVLKNASDKGCLEEVLQSATEMKSVFIALMDSLNSEKSSNSIESLQHSVKTELNLCSIEDSILHCSSKGETEQFVSTYLDSAFSDAQKMRDFVLLVQKPTNNLESTQKLQEIFVKELLKRVDKQNGLHQHSVALQLWNQAPSLLAGVASKSFLFYKCYIDFLVEACHRMKADYDSKNVTWAPDSSDSGVQLTLHSLLLHFKCLLNSDQKVSATTRTLLLSLANNPEESPIYKDICNNLLIR